MIRLLGLIVVSVVVVFTAQNTEVVELRFLSWSFEMSRAVVVFLAFCSGLLLGWLTPWRRRREPLPPAETALPEDRERSAGA